MTTLPNPFYFAGCVEHIPASSAVASSPQPSSGDATAVPILLSPMTMEDIKARPAVVEPIIAGVTDRFILDEEAFFNDIEPLPAFLSAPSQSYLRASDLIPVLRMLARHA